MKLQKRVAKCNKKQTNAPTKVEIARSNSSTSSVVIAMLYDAIGRQVATDNVLILGSNREWNQQVSLLIQAAFAQAGRQTKIISAIKFLSTQILFKIPGLNLRVHAFGVSISKLATAILQSLNIKEGKAISIGLLASLGIKEFCVVNSRNICKRAL